MGIINYSPILKPYSDLYIREKVQAISDIVWNFLNNPKWTVNNVNNYLGMDNNTLQKIYDALGKDPSDQWFLKQLLEEVTEDPGVKVWILARQKDPRGAKIDFYNVDYWWDKPIRKFTSYLKDKEIWNITPKPKPYEEIVNMSWTLWAAELDHILEELEIVMTDKGLAKTTTIETLVDLEPTLVSVLNNAKKAWHSIYRYTVGELQILAKKYGWTYPTSAPRPPIPASTDSGFVMAPLLALAVVGVAIAMN